MVDEVAKMKATGVGQQPPEVPAASAVTPPDAPPSDPTMASRAPAPTAEEKAAAKEAEKAAKAAAKEAEKVAKAAAKAAEKAAKEQARAAEAEAVAKRVVEQTVDVPMVEERPPAMEPAAAVANAVAMAPPPPPTPPTPAPSPPAPPRGPVTLYVDCAPLNNPVKNFWPFVDTLCMELAQQYGGNDYRTCDPNGKLGFGKYKGVIAWTIRSSEVPAGS
jgi:hypothetical protein